MSATPPRHDFGSEILIPVEVAMRKAFDCWRGVLAVAACMLVAAGAVLQAQGGTGSVSGNVLDPDSRVVVNAVVLVRNEATNEIRTTATDAAGHFSVTSLVPGLYAIEVAVPGFEIVRRSGIQASVGAPEDVSIKLSVANISETVTVSTALPAAAVAAPSQGSLTARSAESLISNEYIRNYTSPFSDYSQVLQMAPGTFSVSANGPGLSDTKTFYRGFKDGQYSMTFDGCFSRHRRSARRYLIAVPGRRPRSGHPPTAGQ
jgi:iron complex outermembrane receptor protein